MSISYQHRKLLKRREIPGGVRYLTFSCEKQLPLMANPAIRDAVRDGLLSTRERFMFQLYAWVIMPEHVHLLVRPAPGMPLSRALTSFKLGVAQQVIARWRKLNAPVLTRITRRDGAVRFWLKGGGFDRNPRDTFEFASEVAYIHRNPVKRGLVIAAEEWPWSSVRWWMGSREGEPSCDPPPGDPRMWAHWTGYK